LAPGDRSRQVTRGTGQFLFAFVAPQTDCEVLEIGGSRGYSTVWLAAGVRYLGGRVLSLEHDPNKIAAWRTNIADAGLEDWADLVEGDAFDTLPAIDDVFDLVFLDAEKEDYERLFELAAPEARACCGRDRRQRALARGDAGHVLARPAGGRNARVGHSPARPRPGTERRPQVAMRARTPTRVGRTTHHPLRSTIPSDSAPVGVKFVPVLRKSQTAAAATFALTAERRWSESGDFKFGQWRYQRVEVCPRHLRGIA
jgi:hypothetical protein